jgi:hypothetical protein
VLITPSSWGSQLTGYNHHLHASHQAFFWRRCRGGKRRPLQGEFFARTSFTLFYSFALHHFYLHCFISKTQKNLVYFIVAFIYLLLVHHIVP